VNLQLFALPAALQFRIAGGTLRFGETVMTKVLLGVLLMVAGFLAFAHEGFSFVSHQPWLDQAAIEQGNPLPLWPAFGAIAMFAGFVLIALYKDDSVRRRA
jgi:hypothetical protein